MIILTIGIKMSACWIK